MFKRIYIQIGQKMKKLAYLNHLCPICDAYDCPSEEHAQEWLEATTW